MARGYFYLDPRNENRGKLILLFFIGCILIFSGFLFILFSNARPKPEFKPPPLENHEKTVITEDVEIVKTYVREGRQYYTYNFNSFLDWYRQGLTFKDENTLLESTGLYGESEIQYIDLNKMEVIQQTHLDKRYFGEGCDFYNMDNEVEIGMLTWRERAM